MRAADAIEQGNYILHATEYDSRRLQFCALADRRNIPPPVALNLLRRLLNGYGGSRLSGNWTSEPKVHWSGDMNFKVQRKPVVD